VLKLTLESVRLLLTVSYRKIGEQDVIVAPPIILLGEQLLPLGATVPPAFPVPAPMVERRIHMRSHRHVGIVVSEEPHRSHCVRGVVPFSPNFIFLTSKGVFLSIVKQALILAL